MCLSTITTQGFAEKQPEIVSTILPIHLLASEIAGEHASSQLLIPANQNLHHYTLKPSALRTLSNADLIIRVSPTLERFLNKSLEKKNVITWMSLKGIRTLPVLTDHSHDHHDHEEQHQDDLKAIDSHLWFNPQNARLLIDQIVAELSQLDSAHAKDYAQNAKNLKKKITKTEEKITKDLSNRALSYAVFHDAWQYFQDAFKVNAPRTLKIQEGIPPSVKQVSALRKHLKEDNIACLIASPENSPSLLKALVQGKATKILILDPKGASLPEGSNGYTGLLTHTAAQLQSCNDLKTK